MVYSPSRLGCFEKCPRQFRYRYVDRLPAPGEGIEAFLGKRVHEVLERLHVFVRGGRVPSLAAVLRRFAALWSERFDPEGVRIARPETTPEDYFAAGERCLRNFYRRHYPFDADETVALEERVTFALDHEGAYRMQGIIDRLVRTRDGRLEIHDYKTSRRVPPQRVLDQDRQLGLYELGVRERFPEAQEVRLVWHYLHSNEIRSSTRSPQQHSALREETIELIDRIRTEEEFAPRPSPLCGWCEYRELCPASGARAEASAQGESGPEAPPAPAPGATTERGQLSLL